MSTNNEPSNPADPEWRTRVRKLLPKLETRYEILRRELICIENGDHRPEWEIELAIADIVTALKFISTLPRTLDNLGFDDEDYS